MQTKGMYRMSQRLGLRKAPRILDVDQAEEFVIEEEGKKKLCNKGTNNGDDPIIDPTSVYFGEHIYIKRLNNLYSHHGIRTGENSVIHYGGAFVDQNLIKKGAGRIYLSTLRSFASEEDVEKGRIIVRKYSACDPAPVTVARAIALLNHGHYSLAHSNCEHFATFCKTGKWASTQVQDRVSFLSAYKRMKEVKITELLFKKENIVPHYEILALESSMLPPSTAASHPTAPFLHRTTSKIDQHRIWYNECVVQIISQLTRAFDSRRSRYIYKMKSKLTSHLNAIMVGDNETRIIADNPTINL